MIPIKTDSRKVNAGDTFVAIKGYTVDGHDYIKDAIKNGATKIVCEKGSYEVETEVVPDTKEWLQQYIVSHYKDIIKKLTFIGVTGTNGKTTTCFLTYQMLKKLGVKVAYIGTIGFYFGEEFFKLPNTTPEILDLYSLFVDVLEKGCTHVVMEVSSHALDLKRVEGISFQVEAFTNLTEDHLDYHKTMENYLEAKLLILKQLKENGKIIVNVDDSYGEKFLVENSESLGYMGENYKIIKYESTDRGNRIFFTLNGEEMEVETNLKSIFNVYNYLTSFAIVKNLGYSPKKIIDLAKEIYAPKGRCEQFKVNGGEAIIDYAHTPDAVEKITKDFQKNKKGKIITIIGCGGDRDSLKRPIMGHIVTENSDYVIFTEDNPRTEDLDKILQDILNGVEKNNYEIVKNRSMAIQKGLDMLQKDDVVLILGKGHEDYQIIGHEKIHYSDLEEVEKYRIKKNLSD